jgi:hypothetical protein
MTGRARLSPGQVQIVKPTFFSIFCEMAKNQWGVHPIDATFDRSAVSFDDPDHVSIVIHNYRWRPGLAEGGQNMAKVKPEHKEK